MRMKTHKLFWAWSFDKEEKWLNEMSAQGWHLCASSFLTYMFEEGDPGAYQYRLELLNNLPGHPESKHYIRFLEETGVEMISSWGRWVYFRRKSDSGSFDLFSDADSRITHLNRILTLIGVLTALNLIGSTNLIIRWPNWGGDTEYVLAVAFCSLVALLFVYGFIRLARARHRLIKERILHE